MSKLGIKTTIFLIPVMAVLVLFSAGTIHAQSDLNIPDWVKDTALYWAEGSLTDQDFVNALQYLITNGIITIPNAINTEVIENEPSIDLAQSDLNIPNWVKNTALWWAEGSLTDQDFVNALQYLITNGIITIPNAINTEVIENEPSIDLPYDIDVTHIGTCYLGYGDDFDDNACEPYEIDLTLYNCGGDYSDCEPDHQIDIPYDIDVKFGQATYEFGDKIEVRIETDSPDHQDVRITLFAAFSGYPEYSSISRDVRTNDSGTAVAIFNAKIFYQSDAQLTAAALFLRDTKDIYTDIANYKGLYITELELDIDTEKIVSHTPYTVKVALSEAVSKRIAIEVGDLYFGSLTTNDFGLGETEFTVPNVYLEDVPVTITAAFGLQDPPILSIPSIVGFTKVDLTLTSDKTAYAAGDTITITIATDPPVSTQSTLHFGKLEGSINYGACFDDHSGISRTGIHIQTNADGIQTITGKIAEDDCGVHDVDIHGNPWDRGFSVYTSDPRFEQTNELIIAAK